MDSSYFVAALFQRDQWHQRAVAAWSKDLRPVTSNLVLNETVTLLQSRGHYSSSLDFLRQTRARQDLRVIHVDPAFQAQAWDLFARYGGGGATIIDCSSFAIMRSLSIRRAFTFDQHFRAAGFEILA